MSNQQTGQPHWFLMTQKTRRRHLTLAKTPTRLRAILRIHPIWPPPVCTLPGVRGELTRSEGYRLTVVSPKVRAIGRCPDANLIHRSTEAINPPGENRNGTLKIVKTCRRTSKGYASMAVTALGLVAGGQAPAATISPSTLPQLTTIDKR